MGNCNFDGQVEEEISIDIDDQSQGNIFFFDKY